MVYIYYILYIYIIIIIIYINLQCSDLPWQVEYIERGCKDDNSTWGIEYRYGIWNSHNATSNQIRRYIFFKYDRAQFPTQWPPLTSRIDWERLQRAITLHVRMDPASFVLTLLVLITLAPVKEFSAFRIKRWTTTLLQQRLLHH